MARPRSDIAPRVVIAARERFLKDGVDGASLRAIAHDARTSIGMIYYYFPTKDDLFLAVVEQVYEKVLADMASALEASPFNVRAYPSSAVIVAEGDPGTFRRMVLIEFPYWEP